MKLLFLNDQDVRTLLDLDQLLEALAEGFVALSDGRAVAPNRSDVSIPGKGFLLTMPAWQPGNHVSIKMVAVFREIAGMNQTGHPALITLFDQDSGAPVALMDGRFITTMRTAAAAALSVKFLAQQQTRTLAIIGAGTQAQAHLAAIPRVRGFEDIRIASPSGEARKLSAQFPHPRSVSSNEEAVRGADVICLCTDSSTPVIQWDWVSPGAHITSVGYAAPGGELPAEAVERGRLFVETRRAFEPAPVGCAELAGQPPERGTELGEVIGDRKPGRRSEQEITVYKSMGHAME
ncbi:MAG: ornithine cyclodeaminase family protein, partial [Gemmatimonadota bacterium]